MLLPGNKLPAAFYIIYTQFPKSRLYRSLWHWTGYAFLRLKLLKLTAMPIFLNFSNTPPLQQTPEAQKAAGGF